MVYTKIDLSTTPSLKRLAYENLLNQIISGHLSPGSRLMEEEIAKAMNVSRAPIREALNMLERDGFTKIIPNKGSVVTEVTKGTVLEVWEARKLIEPYSAKTSCRLAPKKEVLQVYNNLNKLENKQSITKEEFSLSDEEVHMLLCKYLPNNFLKNILLNVHAHSRRMQWYTSNDFVALLHTSVQEHKKIISAILEDKEDKVFQETYYHLVNSEKRILENMATF